MDVQAAPWDLFRVVRTTLGTSYLYSICEIVQSPATYKTHADSINPPSLATAHVNNARLNDFKNEPMSSDSM